MYIIFHAKTGKTKTQRAQRSSSNMIPVKSQIVDNPMKTLFEYFAVKIDQEA